jgi:hypothetical protein
MLKQSFILICKHINSSPSPKKAPVYKQKVYDYDDIAVGYEFVHTLYRGRDGALKVDLNLIDDVMEQKGGGGESLDVN